MIESSEVAAHAARQDRRNANGGPIIEAHRARQRILGEMEKQLVNTTVESEYVGQKIRVLIPLHIDLAVTDEVTQQMETAAREAIDNGCALESTTAADIQLLWVKPCDEVPETGFTDPYPDLNIWCFEATAEASDLSPRELLHQLGYEDHTINSIFEGRDLQHLGLVDCRCGMYGHSDSRD